MIALLIKVLWIYFLSIKVHCSGVMILFLFDTILVDTGFDDLFFLYDLQILNIVVLRYFIPNFLQCLYGMFWFGKLDQLERCVTIVGDQSANYINLPKECVTYAGKLLDLMFTHDLSSLTKSCPSVSTPIKLTLCKHTCQALHKCHT